MNVRWYQYKEVPLPPFKLLQYGDKGIFRKSDAGLPLGIAAWLVQEPASKRTQPQQVLSGWSIKELPEFLESFLSNVNTCETAVFQYFYYLFKDVLEYFHSKHPNTGLKIPQSLTQNTPILDSKYSNAVVTKRQGRAATVMETKEYFEKSCRAWNSVFSSKICCFR